MVFNATFNNSLAISWQSVLNGGGNRSTRKKPPTNRKSMSNGTYLVLKRIWNPIDFQGQKSRSLSQIFRNRNEWCRFYCLFHGKNHQPIASQCLTFSHNVVSSTSRHERGSNSQL
jgi:hypothetical protein